MEKIITLYLTFYLSAMLFAQESPSPPGIQPTLETTTLSIDVDSDINLFYDRTKLTWNNLAEVGIDDYDAVKLNQGNYYAPRIGLELNNYTWAISAMPYTSDSISIPIKVWSNIGGSYRVTFQPELAFMNATIAHVYNKKTQEKIHLYPGLTISLDLLSLEENTDLVLVITGTANGGTKNPLCYMDYNGGVYVTPPTKDTWLIVWRNNVGTEIFSETVDNTYSKMEQLPAGTYIAYFYHPEYDIKSFSLLLTEPTEILISANKTNETCYGDKQGIIDMGASGGTGTFTYYINNYITDSYTNNLTSGVYNIYAQDIMQCTSDTKTITIEAGVRLEYQLSQSSEMVDLSNNEPVIFEYHGMIPDRVHWDFGDGGMGSGLMVTHTFSEPNTFAITGFAEFNGCRFYHEPMYVKTIENTTSINQTEKNKDINIFFSSGQIRIFGNNLQQFHHLLVHDLQGQKIFSENVQVKSEMIIPIELKNGVYVITLLNKEGSWSKKTVVIN